MKQVVVAIFNEESRTYEALSNLKNQSDSLNVLAAGIIRNHQGKLVIKDGFDLTDNDNWAVGGLIGGLIGILGGPVGILLGSGLGLTIGTGFDLDEADTNESVLSEVANELKPEKLALISILEEENARQLDNLLIEDGAMTIIRKKFVDVQAEIYQNQELENHLAKEARRQMRQEKKEKWHAMAEAKQQELTNKLKHLKK